MSKISLLVAGVVGLVLTVCSTVVAHERTVIVPLGGSTGDAMASDVVKGKTFSSRVAGKGVAGALELPPTMQTFTNDYGMTFNLLPAGTFMMGSPDSELGRNSNETLHQVTLTKPFYMQTTEVTQEQWRSVVLAAEVAGHLSIGVLDEEPSGKHSGAYLADYPVEQVSWSQARDWLTALNLLTQRTGCSTIPNTCYSLPTEAQWEYGARATTTTPWAYLQSFDTSTEGYSTALEFNPNLAAIGWYYWNQQHGYSNGTKPVAKKQPNKWGLYDMSGNVIEWCKDWYSVDYYSSSGANIDPLGPTGGDYKVLRGGEIENNAGFSRSASRYKASPDCIYSTIGLRVVLPVT